MNRICLVYHAQSEDRNEWIPKCLAMFEPAIAREHMGKHPEDYPTDDAEKIARAFVLDLVVDHERGSANAAINDAIHRYDLGNYELPFPRKPTKNAPNNFKPRGKS